MTPRAIASPVISALGECGHHGGSRGDRAVRGGLAIVGKQVVHLDEREASGTRAATTAAANGAPLLQWTSSGVFGSRLPTNQGRCVYAERWSPRHVPDLEFGGTTHVEHASPAGHAPFLQLRHGDGGGPRKQALQASARTPRACPASGSPPPGRGRHESDPDSVVQAPLSHNQIDGCVLLNIQPAIAQNW